MYLNSLFGSFYGIDVGWRRGGREMFRYPCENTARAAANYLGTQHPDVKFAVYVGLCMKDEAA